MEKLGINQLKSKEVKKNEDKIKSNKYDDEFDQVFEVSEKLSFKDEEEERKLAETIRLENEKKEQEKREKEKREQEKREKEKREQEKREQEKREQEKKRKEEEKKRKEEEIKIKKQLDEKKAEEARNLEEINKQKELEKEIVLKKLKEKDSNKIIKEEIIKNDNLDDNPKDNFIKINTLEIKEEKKENHIDRRKNEFINENKEISFNSINDEVELKNIDWNANFNNKDLAKTSSDFRFLDDMKKYEKNFQINHDIPDLKGVKSKIDTGLRRKKDSNSINNFNKTGMTNNFFKKNDDNNEIPLVNTNNQASSINSKDEMADKYQKLERDNQNDLKKFIQTVMANKMEKRNNYLDKNNV